MAYKIMDSNSSTVSANIRTFDSLSLSDLHLDHDICDDDVDIDYDYDNDDDDIKEEFLCPFCAEYYDVVALCCHIDDQHPLHAHTGVCPLCAKKVGVDLVGHITKEHGNFLKMQRNKRYMKGASSNSMLRKELKEGIFQPIYGGSSCIASSNCEPDPLLLSFIFTSVVADEALDAQPCPFEATQEKKESSQEDFLERKPEQLQLLNKDARRFEFVHGLLMSALLDDNL